MILLYVFVVILLLKLVLNTRKYVSTKRFHKKYLESFINDGCDLIENKRRVLELFGDAGVKDRIVSNAQLAGYGMVATGTASVMENFPYKREDIATLTHVMFREANGVYRSRITETFNPLFWLEAVVNLPKHLCSYLGVSAESFGVKIFQLLYWFFGVIGAVIYGVYRNETESFVRNFIDGLLQR